MLTVERVFEEECPWVFENTLGKDSSQVPKDAGGSTPAILLMDYQLRSRLDNAVAPPGHLAPQSPVDRHVPGLLQPGERAWVKNFGQGEPWIPARIASSDGTRTVNADGPQGSNIRRHSDQIKPRVGEHDLDDGACDPERQEETASPQVVGTPGQGPAIRQRCAGWAGHENSRPLCTVG